MKNRASSYPAERPARAWYRERWPWLLMAGPATVVVASLASAWLAVASDDGLVAQDYYKQGLLINQTLRNAPAVDAPQLGATVRVAADGAVRARLLGLPDAPPSPPATVRLKLAHPGHAAPEVVVTLTRAANGDYVGVFAEPAAGRWIVTLESDTWRLPTTTVLGRLTAIDLGVVAGRS